MPRLPRLLALLALSALAGGARGAESPERLLGKCGVTWDSPSRDALDSMPLSGSRGAGANVWFSGGALRLYLAHAGAYDADDVLRKLGALTIGTPGVDLTRPKSFRQELDLAQGAILIELVAQDGTKVSHRLQFGGESLIIETTASRPLRLEVAYGSWRARPQATSEDTVEVIDGALLATHRNRLSTRGGRLAAEQGIPEKSRFNPAHSRVYGCAVDARGGLAWGRARQARSDGWLGHEWPGLTPEAGRHLVVVTLGAGQKLDPARWVERSKSLLDPEVLAAVRTAATQRWEDFWRRSYIFVQPAAGPADPAFQVGRNYQLFRYMLACNQDGEIPLLFNGGIFTVEPRAERLPARLNLSDAKAPAGADPDYRRRDTAFPGQNQRWIGWPTLASGDADLAAPSLAFYRDRLPVAQARAAAAKASGAVYPEMLSLAGHVNDPASAQGFSTSPQRSHQFSSGLEHAWMALQCHLTTGADLRPHLPWILGQLRFFDSFYRARNLERAGTELDKDGRLLLQPSNSLGLAVGATNPVEAVAALRALVAGLLETKVLAAPDREFLASLQERLPELPVADRKGYEVLLPARSWQRLSGGWELPELQAAWPYRLVGVTQPDTLPLARTTWNLLDEPRGESRQVVWHKLDVSGQSTWAYAAALGWPDEAQRRALAKLSDAASPLRFPAFFGPGTDWIPDHNWGGSAMVGLQEMLVAPQASATGKIHLLPAWPRNWDVVFRLRAPGETLINGEVAGGKLVRLDVVPDERRRDIVLPQGWSLPPR